MEADSEQARAAHGLRRVVGSMTRWLLTSVLIVVVYYQAPLDRPATARVGLWLVLGLVGLGVAVTWQARAIVVSPTPWLKAIETVAIGLPLLLVLYASIYSLMSAQNPASFSETLDRTDALYYTMTVFATVGFGDITPTAQGTRIVTMTQMVVGLLAVGVVARLLFGVAQRAADRQKRRQD